MWARNSPALKLVYRDSAQLGRSILNSTRRCGTKPKLSAIISTLDPERLQTSDFSDFSNVTSHTIIARLKDGTRIEKRYLYDKARALPFPPKTQGFLYYHRHPNLPPTTGEIRFRVTESSDPTSFHSGTDLMRSDGALPWSIPYFGTVCGPLKRFLNQDQNIPVTISRHRNRPPGVFLTYLEQPFVLTLERPTYISMIDSQLSSEKSAMRILLPMPGDRTQSVFKGKILVRFEQASLSEHRHDNSIVMRVLKVLGPIQPLVEDAALLQPTPEEGTLLKSVYFGQVRTLSFERESLRLLPSIMGSSSPPTNPIPPKTPLVDISTRAIGTLNPHRLESSDFMKISDAMDVRLYRRDLRSFIVMRYAFDGPERLTFPANTQGFLYMFFKPGLPQLSGQIRFRLTPSEDPAQFEKGTDLLTPQGQPWNISMVQLTHKCYAPLREQLYHDGYVELTNVLSKLPPDMSHRRRSLSYLEEPFVSDLSQKAYQFTSLGPNGDTILWGLPYLFFDYTKKVQPYAGRIVLRFERSPLPEHKNGNFVVLRVLKLLDPVKFIDPHYDRYIPVPIVGDLVRRLLGRVRFYDLDSKHYVSNLRILPSIPDDEPDLKSWI